MQDGQGQLADGTTFKRESGETKGKNGYWYRWTLLSGISPKGKVSMFMHTDIDENVRNTI